MRWLLDAFHRERSTSMVEGSDKNDAPGRTGGTQIEDSVARATEELLAALPNDLTRLVYLASIRDYNSGIYRHSVLSGQYEAMTAHSAFEACHQEVFARLLTYPIVNYVEQLEGYIRFSRSEREPFIAAWRSLQAYKAAVPLNVPQRACEMFFLNMNAALLILELNSAKEPAGVPSQIS